MLRCKMFLTTISVLLLAATPAFAVDTAKTYTSGVLALAFVGLCGLIVVAQLLPALKALFGITQDAAESAKVKSAKAVSRN